jgi:hypothetical protein
MKQQALTSSTILLILSLLAVTNAQQPTTLTTNMATANIQSTGTIIYPQPGQIFFSGYIWETRNSILSDPGPNYWSNRPENLWIDDEGFLHLKITYSDGRWVCPEICSAQPFGFGTYTFYTASNIDTLDKNVVLGLFAYKDDNHEVDIEFSRWGIDDYTNAGFTIQPKPYIAGYNQKQFNIHLTGGTYSTHHFVWSQASVHFESNSGFYPAGTAPETNLIQKWSSSFSPDAIGVRAMINLWLYEGNPPSDMQPVEVVIARFEFTAL